MNIFLRILLALYAFCLALISAAVMLITIRTEYFTKVVSFLDKEVFSNSALSPRIIVIVVSAVFFILSITFLFSGVKNNKDRRSVKKKTEIGEIKISLNSIENIALNSARRVNGVKDTKAFVKRIEDSVAISVKIVVMPDISIPTVYEEIQNKVKQDVEANAGIAVKNVKVLVDSIYSGNTAIKA